jgi:hypothetical protein
MTDLKCKREIEREKTACVERGSTPLLLNKIRKYKRGGHAPRDGMLFYTKNIEVAPFALRDEFLLKHALHTRISTK